MKYVDAIRGLYSLERLGVRLGLQRMQAALGQRKNPHRGTRFIHVAGTNGKGSVCAMLEAIYRAEGYRTGLYTSPHLHRFTERIRIAGRPISQREAAERVGELLLFQRRASCGPLTFFEASTLIAFEAFADARCDVVILEVGMGGRLDATNVVRPELCVITRIALDHVRPLGGTLAAIAGEKAGILKRGVPLVCGVTAPSATRVIAQRARSLRVRVTWVEHPTEIVDGLALPLRGDHQCQNAALSVAAVRSVPSRALRVSEEAIRKGLRRTKWPGRLEWIPGRPRVLLDAAHNPDGCEALARYLRSVDRTARRVLLFGVMQDKDYRGMLDRLLPEVDEVVYCEADLNRALGSAELRRVHPGRSASSVIAGLRDARRRAGSHGIVVVAGSIFVMAAAREALLGIRADPPIPM